MKKPRFTLITIGRDDYGNKKYGKSSTFFMSEQYATEKYMSTKAEWEKNGVRIVEVIAIDWEAREVKEII